MTTPDNNALLQLQVDAGIPHTPTPLTYELRLAVSGKGPRAYDWSDKPHRLLYDACREIERNAEHVTALEDLCQQSYCDAMDYAADAMDLKEENARLRAAWWHPDNIVVGEALIAMQAERDAAIVALAEAQEKIDELRDNETWRKIHND